MSKPKKKAKRPERTPNERFGRQKAVPFKDVVERLLGTPPGNMPAQGKIGKRSGKAKLA
jgi:hypothetical protein